MSAYVVSGYWVDGYAEGDESSTTYLIAAANSTQANTASPGSISQTHLVTAANATQTNSASQAAVTQGAVTTQVTAADSTQTNVASAGSVSVSTGLVYWPTPAQVLYGVQYGPTGADYTGTATGGSGPTAAEIAAAVRADLAAELLQLTKVSKLHGIGVDLVVTPTSRTAGSLVQSISTAGDAVTVSAA